jgi:hypothetical protein
LWGVVVKGCFILKIIHHLQALKSNQSSLVL